MNNIVYVHWKDLDKIVHVKKSYDYKTSYVKCSVVEENKTDVLLNWDEFVVDYDKEPKYFYETNEKIVKKYKIYIDDGKQLVPAYKINLMKILDVIYNFLKRK